MVNCEYAFQIYRGFYRVLDEDHCANVERQGDECAIIQKGENKCEGFSFLSLEPNFPEEKSKR